MIIPNETEPFLYIFSFEPYIPKLLYYTHIPALIMALTMGIFIYTKSKERLHKTLISLFFLCFNLWIAFSLVSWIGESTHYMMFVWKYFELLDVLMAFWMVYFFLVYIHGNEERKGAYIWLAFSTIPSLILSFTEVQIPYYDIRIADAESNQYTSFYSYSVCVLLFFAMFLTVVRNLKKLNKIKRNIICSLFCGAGLYMVVFLGLEIQATYKIYSLDITAFDYEPLGLFSITIYIASLAYVIVRYKAFGIELKETRVLIISLLMVVGAQLFAHRDWEEVILTAVTLLISAILGYMLMQVIKSEEKKKVEVLQKANSELLKLDQAKSDFINMASHQLRTPLTVVKGVASMLVSGKIEKIKPEDKQVFYQSVWNKCLKLEHIIDGILNATSLASKKDDIMNQGARPVELVSLICVMLQELQPEIEKKGLEVNLTCQESLDTTIIAQKEYLEEALLNLITNAIKYTPATKTIEEPKAQRTEPGKVAIAIAADPAENESLLITITDNGIGIPADEIPKLFQRFYRAENAKRMYTDGSGLGLYIVKEIIEGHGGSIKVESELDKGTTISVRLPMKPSRAPDIRQQIMKQTKDFN